MLEIISALWPVFALILLGYVARLTGFPGAGFWDQAEKATYFVLFPVLLVYKLSLADMSGVPLDTIALAVVMLVTGGSIVAVLLKRGVSTSPAGFSSVYQGGVRFNTYVGLAASASLFGGQGVAIAAVIVAVMVPLLNLYCVLMFTLLMNKTSSIAGVLMAILKNPLIIACLSGLTLNQTGVGLPAVIEPVAELLSRMALPLGLLAVGAGLSFKVLKGCQKEFIASSAIKLLIMPVISLGIAVVLELDSVTSQLLLLFAALPTASSAYILARQLGGDAPMIAAIITGQTLLSMLTIPLVLTFLI